MEKEHLEKFNERIQIKPLTKVEKEAIFSALRYSFMTHQQLINMLSEPGFEEAKDYIREGISFRLISYEQEAGEDVQFKINTKPRDLYYLPDIAIADVEHEKVDEKNPLSGLLKKHIRQEVKSGVIDKLTDEQQVVMRQQKAHQVMNPFLKKGQQEYLKKIDDNIHEEGNRAIKTLEQKKPGTALGGPRPNQFSSIFASTTPNKFGHNQS